MNPEEVTRLWQRLIAVENKLGELSELSRRLDDHGAKINSTLSRLSTLEEARQRQINFNSEVSKKLATSQPSDNNSLFRFFKR